MEENEYGREVGRRIILARKELGISQAELAELVHVSERSMQAYESGEVVPYRKLRDLSEVVNRPMGWILHGDQATETSGELAPILREILERMDTIVEALSKIPLDEAA